jgi:hypothetical protein
MGGRHLLELIAAGVLSAALARFLPAPFRRPAVRNHRGLVLPYVLGPAAWLSLTAVLLADLAVRPQGPPSLRGRIALVAALAVVYAAGRLDDRQPERMGGLRTHAAALLRGQVSTGAVKAVAIVAAAALWAVAAGAAPARLLVGVPVVAGTANLVNLLDVAPGRAIKWFLVVAIPLLAGTPSGVLAGGVGTGAGVLRYDLEERAMLGDAGANLLGFVAGVGLFVRLPVWGLAVALAVLLALHAVAETVTLTRVLRSVPPLRWFDDLGRLRVAGTP